MCAEVGLGEGDAEGGVGGKVEGWVALSPVFYYGYVYGGGGADAEEGLVSHWRRRLRDGGSGFNMLTGNLRW